MQHCMQHTLNALQLATTNATRTCKCLNAPTANMLQTGCTSFCHAGAAAPAPAAMHFAPLLI